MHQKQPPAKVALSSGLCGSAGSGLGEGTAGFDAGRERDADIAAARALGPPAAAARKRRTGANQIRERDGRMDGLRKRRATSILAFVGCRRRHAVTPPASAAVRPGRCTLGWMVTRGPV